MDALVASLLAGISCCGPQDLDPGELRRIVAEIASASASVDPDSRGRIGLHLGTLQARCGDREAAEASFEDAAKYLLPDGRPSIQFFFQEIEALIAARVRSGDLEGARATCERAEKSARAVEDPDKRADAINSAALLWTTAGDLRHGRDLLAESIDHDLKKPPPPGRSTDPLQLTLMRSWLARMMGGQLRRYELRHLLLLGDRAKAEALRDTLKTEAKSTLNPAIRRELLLSLSSECLSAGYVDESLAIARLVDDGAGRAKARSLISAAKSLLSRGDRESALGAALQARPLLGPAPFPGPDPKHDRFLRGPDTLAQSPRSLAWVLAELGREDEAIEIAEGIGDRPLRVASLADIALSKARQGRLEEAELLFRRAESEGDSLRPGKPGSDGMASLAWIPRARFEAGLLAGDPMTLAPPAAAGKAGPSLRDTWLTAVAEGYADHGDLDSAFRLTRAIENPFSVSMAFKSIAWSAGRQGDAASLLERALEIEDGEIRIQLLEGLAEGLESRTRNGPQSSEHGDAP